MCLIISCTVTCLVVLSFASLRLSSRMLTSPGALVQGFLTLMTAVTVGHSSFAECPTGKFYNEEREECQPCATCPTNQIIRRPCEARRDTKCTPFFEFHEFHQAPRTRLKVGDLPLEEAGEDGLGKAVGTDSNRSKKHPDDVDDAPNEVFVDSKTQDEADSVLAPAEDDMNDVDDDDLGLDPDSATAVSVSRPRYQDNQGPSMHNPDGAESQWKVLALALIVVLCVVCIFLIMFVFAVCYLRTRRAHLQKVIYSSDMSPSGRALPASHRYIPVLTHAPTPGSSCGGAMRVPPCGMVDSTYLYSEDYDADHSGQTVSTTKSSDYVYFKSPQNGNFCDV